MVGGNGMELLKEQLIELAGLVDFKFVINDGCLDLYLLIKELETRGMLTEGSASLIDKIIKSP